jgi:ATP-binding cassette subfamily G (WHITE) protein 2 (PDR)
MARITLRENTATLALTFGGTSHRDCEFPQAKQDRNIGILLVMFVILGATHLVATEMIPAQRSRGEVLIHRRRTNNRKFKGGDEESATTKTGRGMALSQNFNDEQSCAGLQKHGNHVLAQSELISSGDAAVFHWSNLSYSIQIGKKSRQILHDVEGWVRPGSLTALMASRTFSTHHIH